MNIGRSDIDWKSLSHNEIDRIIAERIEADNKRIEANGGKKSKRAGYILERIAEINNLREADKEAQDEVADKVSKSRVAITNALRLLKLDERVRRMVVEDKIKSGHARALLSIKDGELQYETALQIFDGNLTVRETEKLVKKLLEEAASIGLDKNEVIKLIQSADQ